MLPRQSKRYNRSSVVIRILNMLRASWTTRAFIQRLLIILITTARFYKSSRKINAKIRARPFALFNRFLSSMRPKGISCHLHDKSKGFPHEMHKRTLETFISSAKYWYISWRIHIYTGIHLISWKLASGSSSTGNCCKSSAVVGSALRTSTSWATVFLWSVSGAALLAIQSAIISEIIHFLSELVSVRNQSECSSISWVSQRKSTCELISRYLFRKVSHRNNVIVINTMP